MRRLLVRTVAPCNEGVAHSCNCQCAVIAQIGESDVVICRPHVYGMQARQNRNRDGQHQENLEHSNGIELTLN
jgi:hypothetical protein